MTARHLGDQAPIPPDPAASGTQLRLQGHDRRAQPDQWSLVTLEALAQVAEH